MHLSVVVLPQPLGPRRVTSWPLGTSRLTWSTAGASSLNRLTRSFTTMLGKRLDVTPEY
jgi:hypothetical protein